MHSIRQSRRFIDFLLLMSLLSIVGGLVTAQSARFVRGDANGDGTINITDGVFVLTFLFNGGATPPCLDAADANDSGGSALNITDGIFILSFLFTGGTAPPLPSSGGSTYTVGDCGPDPSADALDCVLFTPCPGALSPRATHEQEGSKDDLDSDGVFEAGRVVLPAGEVRLDRIDLEIPGRGEVHFAMVRRYRSRLEYDGPLGHGWDFRYNDRLFIEADGDVVRLNGRGHLDTWRRRPDGSFQAPPGHFRTLVRSADGSYVLRSPNGYKRRYDAAGRLARHEDRNGNQMRFEYDGRGNLDRVIDAYDREIDFIFEDVGGHDRLTRIVDFVGREILYSYDARGDLASVRSPIVSGTSTGNNFPDGRTEAYGYLSGTGSPDLDHNISELTFPEEVARGGAPGLRWTYGMIAGAIDFDRVVEEAEGGLNHSGVAAGGSRHLLYEELSPGEPDGTRTRVAITERNGNRAEVSFNGLGQQTLLRRFTRGVREPEPESYNTLSFYNEDHLLTSRVDPAENAVQLRYDSGTRGAECDVIEIRRVAGPRGGGEDLVHTFVHEPLFREVAAITDPRGNATSFLPPLGTAGAARYTTHAFFDYQEGNNPVAEALEFGIDLSGIARGLGDLNGDGRTDQETGNRVRLELPAVQLASGSLESQRLGSLQQLLVVEERWNDHGQIVAVVDQEGNVAAFDYYPGEDPDGDGGGAGHLEGEPNGYLRSVTVDAELSPRRSATALPAALETTFEYDPVGNVVAIRNPRGVVTAFELNELNELLVMTRGADVSRAVGSGQLVTEDQPFAFRSRRHYDHNGRVVLEEVENSGAPSPGVGEYVERQSLHDILGNLVEASVEIDAGRTATARFRYDGAELLREVIHPEGNRVEIVHDERDLVFTVTRGAGELEAATTRRDYDLSGNLARFTDAADNDGDGVPESYFFRHDGFDRLIETLGPLGSEVSTEYDPASNAVRRRTFGHPAGSPAAAPVLLGEVRCSYDEIQRPFRIDQRLLLADGFNPVRPPQLSDGDGDGQVTTRIEYDALSRPTFVVEDDGEVTRNLYDGASRAVERIDAAGNRSSIEYDRCSNPTRIRAFERSTGDIVPVREVATALYWDQLDRLAILAAERTQRFGYDSRDNLTSCSDAEGTEVPDVTGVFPGITNLPGNTRSFLYDGRDLRVGTVADLREAGHGSRPLDSSNPDNADGQVTVRHEYDLNGRLERIVDDRQNATSFRYDALDRLIEKENADGTRHQFQHDADDNLILAIDPNRTQIRQSFDALHRLVRSEVEPGPGVVGTRTRTFAYDGLSRLTSASDDNGLAARQHSFSDAYDSLGRIIEEVQDGGIRSTEWSGDGKPLAMTYPGGRRITRSFDAIDRTVEVRDATGAIASWDWMGPGQRLLRRTHRNGTQLSMLDAGGNTDSGYDSANRLVRLRHVLGGTSFVERGYNYNRADQRTSEVRHEDGGRTDHFTYDSLYRLARSVYDAGGLVMRTLLSAAYVLDGVGNRRTESLEGGGGDVAYAVNEVNQYTSRASSARTHDANGNLLSDGVYDFAYDFRNRLVEVAEASGGAPVARYEYDALDRRVKSTVYDRAVPGQVVRELRYYYDDSFRIVETVGPEAFTSTCVHGESLDEPVELELAGGGGRLTLHQNARGDVVAVTGSAGAVVQRLVYDDFGAPATQGTSASAYRFHGREFDEETGLYYFRRRHYDPRTGRFLQRDPLFDAANAGNQYTFAANGPVSGSDPLGLQGGAGGVVSTVLEQASWFIPGGRLLEPEKNWKDWIGYSGDGVPRESTIWAFETELVRETPRSVAYGSVVLTDKLTLGKFDSIHEAAEQTYVELGLSQTQKAVHQGTAGVTAFALHCVMIDKLLLAAAGRVAYTEEALQGAYGVCRAGGAIALDSSHVARSRALLEGGTGLRGLLTRLWYRAVASPAQRTLLHEWGHRQIMLRVTPWIARWFPRADRWMEAAGWTYENSRLVRIFEEWTVQTLSNWSPFRNFLWGSRYYMDMASGAPELLAATPRLAKALEVIFHGGDLGVATGILGIIFKGHYKASLGDPPPLPGVRVEAATPLAANPDSFTVPPGQKSTLSVAANDSVAPGDIFLLVSAPTLHRDLFMFGPDGTFMISPLTVGIQSLDFSYRIVRGETTSETVQVTFEVDPGLLHQLPVLTDPQNGERYVLVPCLVLGNLNYPIYQFRLSNNPADVCQPPHWHAGGPVFPVEAPNAARFDPDPPRCGFGLYSDVPQSQFRVPEDDWQDFLLLHIPPV